MSFPILQEYENKFLDRGEQIRSFSLYYNKKLWNELTIEILKFIYHPQVKGKVTFAFYNDFVKKFQKNIDQINLLKIIRQSFASLTIKQILEFLTIFQEKQASTEEIKTIILAFKGFYAAQVDLNISSQIIKKLKTYIETHKDVETYIYSCYYRLTLTFYIAKRKYKNFYTSALQYLAYTSAQEIEENQKLKLLFEMAIAVLISDQIYNFSELLEQPLLVSLTKSQYAWIYELLQIFNKGDIAKYQQFSLQYASLQENKSKLDQKIRLMAFLELAFNLPKSNRIISFKLLSTTCVIDYNSVQLMVMKAMALNLVKGSIDQLKSEVAITWVAPKVLESERVGTMLKKFEQWEQGVKDVQILITQIKVA